MAVVLSAKDVDVEFPTKHVLAGTTLGVNEGDRIGIVGQNGGGKTTLLRVLAGLHQPDSGAVLYNGTWAIGVLEQRDSLDNASSVQSQLDPGSSIPWQASKEKRAIVDALVGDIDHAATIGTLSGGQRRRVDLARLLLGNWDVLMLDEPTNHLDIATINWLAQHLKTRWSAGAGALLVVTHDRWFLDEVCTSMWEVHDGKVLPFDGGYSAYILQRVERARLAEVARKKRANQLRKELAWLSRGAQARRSKPKFHLDQAAALIADEPPLRNSLELKKVASTRLGKQVLELENVSVSLDGTKVLDRIDWIIGPGDRIGILGENGAGKTTLLRLLEGKIQPTEGRLKVGKTVKLAALSQNLEELDAVSDDVVRVVCSRYKTYYEVDGKMLSATAMLERLGFGRVELNARVKDLSGGQRRRLQLLLVLLEEPNVLLLDEPGNDLDTDMMAATEDVLDSWAGTLIVVSHDRHFLERATDDQYAIVDGRVRHMPGGIDEYLAIVSNRNAASANRHDAAKQVAETGDPASAANKVSNARVHQLKKERASLERKMETQQKRVAKAEDALGSCDPYDYSALAQAQATLSDEQDKLAQLEDAWFAVAQELDG